MSQLRKFFVEAFYAWRNARRQRRILGWYRRVSGDANPLVTREDSGSFLRRWSVSDDAHQVAEIAIGRDLHYVIFSERQGSLRVTVRSLNGGKMEIRPARRSTPDVQNEISELFWLAAVGKIPAEMYMAFMNDVESHAARLEVIETAIEQLEGLRDASRNYEKLAEYLERAGLWQRNTRLLCLGGRKEG